MAVEVAECRGLSFQLFFALEVFKELDARLAIANLLQEAILESARR